MTTLSMKVKILQKAMKPFVSWLDSCEQLVSDLPKELETQDFNHLRELALKYKDLLLQMKERCSYMQEVNNLCKEVEREAGSQSLSPTGGSDEGGGGAKITIIPELTEEEELAELEGRDEEFEQKEKDRKVSTISNSSGDVDPRLIELAMEVKDLNTRFANMCMQAKDHYASLSRVLTASIKRQSTLKSSTSAPSIRRKKSSDRQSSSGSPKKNRRSLSHLEEHKQSERKKMKDKRTSCIEIGSTMPDIEHSSDVAASVDTAELTDSSTDAVFRKKGVAGNSRVSVLAGEASAAAKLQRSISLATGTDLSKDQSSSSSETTVPRSSFTNSDSSSGSASAGIGKVLLRRNTVDSEGYSDNQPRQRRRPKSALIIEANPESRTAILSEVQLRDGAGGHSSNILRRRSVEVDYSALAKTGLLSQGSIPNSPVATRVNRRTPRTRFGNQPRDRSSIASIESLDPRAIMMLGGEMERSADYQHQSSFEGSHISAASDITYSTSQVPDYVLEQRFGMWKGIVENGLSMSKRSMSVDALAPKEKQAVTLSSRLSELSAQIQEFVHKIAENRHCALQSLDLQLHLGQLKAISSLMEFQDLELTRYSATYSAASREKLKRKEKTKRLSMTDQDSSLVFSDSEVASCRTEIDKLTDRVDLLKKHCEDAIQQTEEVLEFVCELELQMKNFKEALTRHTSTVEEIKRESEDYTEESWCKLSQAFTDMTEQKAQFHSITELSNQLLNLEPIFNGTMVRDDLLNVKKRFQKVVLELFIQLEAQAKSWTEQLLLEMSVLASWITEAELSMQALDKKSKKPNGVTSKLLDTRASLLKEVQDKLADLEETSNKLEPVSLVLKSDTHKPLGELLRLVEKHLNSLQQIRAGLQNMEARTNSSVSQDKNLLGVIYGGKKHDLVQDKPSFQDRRGVKGRANFQEEEDDDDISPYAEINPLRKQILQARKPPIKANVSSLEPSPGVGEMRGRVTSISGQTFSLPGVKARAITDESADLYERVEEVLPSPFVDQDMSSTKKLDTAIENISNQRKSSNSSMFDPHATYSIPPRAVPKLHVPSSHATPSHLSPTHSTPVRPKGFTVFPSQGGSPTHSSPSHYAIPPARSNPAKPKRIQYTEIDVSIYDNPKLKNTSLNPAAMEKGGEKAEPGVSPERKRRKKKKRPLHEDLLIFVSKEWKDLEMEVLEQQALDSSIEVLGDPQLQSECLELVKGMRETEGQLKMCEDKLLVLRSPQLPDLERVHATIDQCQKLKESIGDLHGRVEDHNIRSLEVTCQLRERIPSEQKVAQLLELLLFDVSILWHVVSMHCASRMSYLRENESSINFLHRELRTFSRTLAEAKVVVEDAPFLLDVEEYLKKAEILHTMLTEQRERKEKLASDLRDRVSVDMQAPVSQELLIQLDQVEGDWQEMMSSLSVVPSLQPLLVLRVVKNGCKETSALRVCLHTLRDERVLDVEEAKTNKLKCQECMLKARQLELSLTYAEKTLQDYVTSPPEMPKLEGEESSTTIQRLLATADNKTSAKPPAGEEEKGVAMPDFKAVAEQCTTTKEDANKLLLELDETFSQLVSDVELLSKFHRVWEDISVWLSDTKSMLEVTLPSSSSSSSTSTSSPSHARPGAPTHSSALLRGKQQAICQQVVARQPKMETLQTLVADILQISAKSSEKQKLETKISELCSDWDELCQQCVPAGVLPLVSTPTGVGGVLGFQPPSDFEDISQMTEWLIHIESRLHPVKLTVGDFSRLKKILRDSQKIEKELKLREKDYKRFTSGLDPEVSAKLDSELENSLDATEAIARPVPVSFSPTKTVKFNDENTLERELRQKEIMKNFGPDNIDSSLESSMLDSDSLPTPIPVPYHAAGPISGGDDDSKLAPNAQGVDPNLVSPVAQSRILNRMSSDPECSLSRLVSTAASTPLTPISEEHYHLVLLWKGIWAVMTQERSRLEAIRERWKTFESKKEEFCRFLFRSEERMASFFRVIGTTKNLGVVQTEMVAQKVFDSDMVVNEQHLTVLNSLSQDLISQFHKDDDTSDLRDTMADLNLRWNKMKDSYTQHQSTVAALMSRWAEFYQEYQSFEKCSQRLDVEMSNMNPFVSDMDAVKTQLEKLKSVQQELQVRDSSLERIRSLVVGVIQGPGGSHLNAEGIHNKLENLTKRWKHLQTLATERKTALEQALSEKQDFLSLLADCLAWLNKAEKHLKNQKPLGMEAKAVANQLKVQQEFWQEVQSQQKRMETVITSGRHMMMERHWPKETADGLKAGCSGVENRWKWVWSEAEEWGKLLETVHPEMEKFQALCTDCGKKLSDAELIMEKFDTVSRKVPVLKKQLEKLQVYERTIVEVGDNLGVLVNSQKRQLELGVRKSVELFQMVKRYHQRWNTIRDTIEKRHADIEAAMIKYDPTNLGVATLPRGWVRKKTDENVPYFLHTSSHNEPQWSHPDLFPLYVKVRCEHTLSSYPSSAYPVALRLREIQKRTQLSLLHTREAMEAYEDHAHQFGQGHPAAHGLSPYESTVLAVDMYQRLEEVLGVDDSTPSSAPSSSSSAGKSSSLMKDKQKFYINSAVELTTSWIRDLFDQEHKGPIPCSSFMLAIIAMSSGKLDEKYRALFNVVSGHRNSIDLEQLTNFLEQIIQIPQLVCDEQFCSLHALDICAKECFKKFVGIGRLQLPGFISWLQSEPLPLSWLPVLHRLAAAESSLHEVKCGVCKTTPIQGFRYRCIQCSNLDMCQVCYWSGKTSKGHDKSKHYMEEYCVVSKHGDEMKDFFKSFQKSFRRKKKENVTKPGRKESLAPTQVGGSGVHQLSTSTSNSVKSKTWSSTKHSPPPGRGGAVRGEEHHPGRRFTVTEDLKSAWTRGGLGGGAAGAKDGVENNRRALTTNEKTKFAGGRKTAASSMMINEVGQHPRFHGEDMETSLNKIKETTLNLSRHIMQMKEHQLRPPTIRAQDYAQTNGSEAESRELALKRRNNALQGRVEVLQQHNRRLEGCIAQLRHIADMHQQATNPASNSNTLSPPLPYVTPSIHNSPRTSARATPITSIHVTPSSSPRATPTTSPTHGQYTVTPSSARNSPNLSPSHGRYTITKETSPRRSLSPSVLSNQLTRSFGEPAGTSELGPERSHPHTTPIHATPTQTPSTHSYCHLLAKPSPSTVIVGSLSTPNQFVSPRFSGTSQGSSNSSVSVAIGSSTSPRSSRNMGKVPPPQIILNQQDRSQHVERTLL